MTIVIIDDDPSIGHLLSEILKIWNHDVHYFISPVDALDMIKNTELKIDIVFTDYIMDDLTGKDVFNEVTSLNKNILVVITTALVKETVIKDTGCELILEKPFKMGDVKSLIDSLEA